MRRDPMIDEASVETFVDELVERQFERAPMRYYESGAGYVIDSLGHVSSALFVLKAPLERINLKDQSIVDQGLVLQLHRCQALAIFNAFLYALCHSSVDLMRRILFQS